MWFLSHYSRSLKIPCLVHARTCECCMLVWIAFHYLGLSACQRAQKGDFMNEYIANQSLPSLQVIRECSQAVETWNDVIMAHSAWKFCPRSANLNNSHSIVAIHVDSFYCGVKKLGIWNMDLQGTRSEWEESDDCKHPKFIVIIHKMTHLPHEYHWKTIQPEIIGWSGECMVTSQAS